MMRRIWSRPDRIGQTVKSHGLLDGPAQTVGIEVFKNKAVAAIGRDIQMGQRIVNPAGVMPDRKRPVALRDFAGKPAGLIVHGHQHEVRRRKGETVVLGMKLTNCDPVNGVRFFGQLPEVMVQVPIRNENHLQPLRGISGKQIRQEFRSSARSPDGRRPDGSARTKAAHWNPSATPTAPEDGAC